ncbi:hypothetical protein GGI19_000042 [Coemansia pectinata]|uniref:RanBD1 domain-containing protein n=1 Tax=Coemansia pectinata TaxID=1052879 RepID=A0A9W8H689_9FUNG|nr:hypothetical protein GGI19_000042 [Coemansia pectinata]
MSDCDSVENKRKRQDSIKGSKVLLESPLTDCAELAGEEELEDNALLPVAGAAESPAGGSSPVKRPRTSEDGNNSPAPNNAEEAKEAAESVQDKVKGISMEDAPKKPALPVFGSAFGVSGKPGGFSSFASAGKKASPFAAFTTAASGFAKYAAAGSSLGESRDASAEGEAAAAAAAGSDSEDVAGNEDLDDDDEVRAPAAGPSQRTFEDLLTTKGKETLQLRGSLGSPASMPLTAHGAPSTPVRTFEEDETCLFSTKAKLFELHDASWKERGGGQFKINSKIEQPDKCRLLMRTDLTFRLILNVPLFHGLKAVCERRFVRFTCFDVESKLPITYVLRFATDALATDAYVCISKNTPEDHDDDEGEDKHSASASEDSDDDDDTEEEEEEEDQGEAKEDDVEESANVAEDNEEEDEDEASQSDAESQAEQQSSAAEDDEDQEEEVQDDASAASASVSDIDDEDASGQEQSEGENEDDEDSDSE